MDFLHYNCQYSEGNCSEWNNLNVDSIPKYYRQHSTNIQVMFCSNDEEESHMIYINRKLPLAAKTVFQLSCNCILKNSFNTLSSQDLRVLSFLINPTFFTYSRVKSSQNLAFLDVCIRKSNHLKEHLIKLSIARRSENISNKFPDQINTDKIFSYFQLDDVTVKSLSQVLINESRYHYLMRLCSGCELVSKKCKNCQDLNNGYSLLESENLKLVSKNVWLEINHGKSSKNCEIYRVRINYIMRKPIIELYPKSLSNRAQAEASSSRLYKKLRR